MIVAVDGPSGAGKSTLGKMLAKNLNLLYLDTGAMYRAVALAVLQRGLDFSDKVNIAEIAEKANIELIGEPDNLKVFLDGTDVSAEIRTLEAAQAASVVSTISEVRRIMVDHQRTIGQKDKKGCVLEGRDIGSVVFPETPYKFYIDASEAVRLSRRHAQGETDSPLKRDQQDTTRKTAPLKVARDALVIDTTHLSLEDVVTRVLHHLETQGFTMPHLGA